MKRFVILLIAAMAYCVSANAQIVTSHYNDSYGSPYFRIDVMKSSYSPLSKSDEMGSFIPQDDGYHGLGVNASIGYYIPLFRTYFFYAPEIGITGRFGNDKESADDTPYNSYFGAGLKVVPLQFGYQFEISSSFSICPRIGMAATFIPFGSVSLKGSDNTSMDRKWKNVFEQTDIVSMVGCDFVFRDSNFFLSLALESGHFTQAGLGLGFLF